MHQDSRTPSRIVRLWQDMAAAMCFLFLGQHEIKSPNSLEHRRVWPIVPLGLLAGLSWVATFRVTWKIFGEIGNLRLIPSLAVVTIATLFSARMMLPAVMRLVEDPRGTSRQTGQGAIVGEKSILWMILILLGMFAIFLSFQDLRGWWPSSNDWRSWFNWMYPRPIYRPFLLAPLWGHWGMLIALSTGRPADSADVLTRAYGRNLGVWKLSVHSMLPLFLTSIYASRGGNLFTGPMIAAILLGLTILFSTIAANLRAGQSRTSVLATGLFTQMMFILLHRAFWPLIER